MAAQVVLGGVDLHRALGAQGGGDPVGADALLDPPGTGEEADPVGAAAQAAFALLPEDVAVRVGDGEDQRRLAGLFEQGAAQDGEQRVEAAGAAAVFDLGGAEVDGGGARVRVEAEAAQAFPGVADLGAGLEEGRVVGGGVAGGGAGGGLGEGALVDLGQFRRGLRRTTFGSSGLPSWLPHSVRSSPPSEGAPGPTR